MTMRICLFGQSLCADAIAGAATRPPMKFLLSILVSSRLFVAWAFFRSALLWGPAVDLAQAAAHQRGAVAVGQPILGAKRVDALLEGQQVHRASPVGASHATVEADGVDDLIDRL